MPNEGEDKTAVAVETVIREEKEKQSSASAAGRNGSASPRRECRRNGHRGDNS
jgi:hypothetical protein